MKEWHGDMAAVAEICGEEVAQELYDHLPGIALYVSRAPRADSLMLRLPEHIAEQLVRQMAGDTIYVSAKRTESAVTFAEIEALIDKGMTVPEVALHMGLTSGWIRECRRNHGAPRLQDKVHPNQLNFFND